MSRQKYSFGRTITKTIRELLIWGVPQAVALIGGTDIGQMTIAGVVSVIAKIILDWLKHK
ncbi:MAG: hypothetical protein K6T54_07065 [Ignavibacterium sp.]|nr:hypothetical protein [Ignavibacterium sp.]